MGVSASLRRSEEKGPSPLLFMDFPGALRTLWKRAKKRQKRDEKGRYRAISRKGGQDTP